MSNTVSIRYRSFLPGAGFDSNGVAKQGKQEVRGVITVTNYARGGEALAPADVGLNRIDYIDLQLEEPFEGADSDSTGREIGYSRSAQQFYINTVDGAGTKGKLVATSDPVVMFNAFGDSAHDVELL